MCNNLLQSKSCTACMIDIQLMEMSFGATFFCCTRFPAPFAPMIMHCCVYTGIYIFVDMTVMYIILYLIGSNKAILNL